MRLIVIRSAIAAAALGIAWLLAGRPLALFLDRWFTVSSTPLSVAPLQYDGGGFLIGDRSMTFGATNNLRFDLGLSTDLLGRVILTSGGQTFLLGPRTNPADPRGRPEIDFVPEAGDVLSFTSSRSFLSWPTPLESHFMIRSSPWWRRSAYYRLDWKKSSGASLQMLWRYEQSYYASSGWTHPDMLWNDRTGLLRVSIGAELQSIVAQYIARTKKWKPADYRIEDRGDVIAVIYLDDERAPHPGAGRSIELNVDRAARRVISERGGQ